MCCEKLEKVTFTRLSPPESGRPESSILLALKKGGVVESEATKAAKLVTAKPVLNQTRAVPAFIRGVDGFPSLVPLAFSRRFLISKQSLMTVKTHVTRPPIVTIMVTMAAMKLFFYTFSLRLC
jgi:hypothetical protein